MLRTERDGFAVEFGLLNIVMHEEYRIHRRYGRSAVKAAPPILGTKKKKNKTKQTGGKYGEKIEHLSVNSCEGLPALAL